MISSDSIIPTYLGPQLKSIAVEGQACMRHTEMRKVTKDVVTYLIGSAEPQLAA